MEHEDICPRAEHQRTVPSACNPQMKKKDWDAMSRGYTLIVVCGLLTLVAFLVAEPLRAWAQ